MPLHDPAHAYVPYPDVPVPHAATGPLSGLRFGVKDLFDVAGYPTGGGSPFVLAMSGIKTGTAPTVQRLRDAGAAEVILEDDLTVDRLASILTAVLSDPARLSAMSAAARSVAIPDAAQRLADLVEVTAGRA